MTASERQEEILRLLVMRRFETVPRLAAQFSVSKRTIYSDITKLTTKYPIETHPGNQGGVSLADWYHPHCEILSSEQQKVIVSILPMLGEHEQRVMREMIMSFGSPEYIKRIRVK